MSDTTVSTLILLDRYKSDVVELINQSCPELALISFKPGAGPNCTWPVSLDGYGSSARWFAEGADFSTFSNDAQQQAILPWARVEDSRLVTGSAIRQAASSGEPQANRGLFLRAAKSAMQTVCSAIASEFYVGDASSNKLSGLNVALHDHNTYAGINRATAANHPFDSSVFDPGTPTDPSLALIRSDLSTINIRSGENPDLALVSHAVLDRIMEKCFDDILAHNISVQGQNGPLVFQGGYDAIKVHGCTFVATRSVPANAIYYINRNHVEFRVQPAQNVPGEYMSMVQGNDGTQPLPFGLMLMVHGKSGDNSKVSVMSELALAVDKPGACGVRLNVKVSG